MSIIAIISIMAIYFCLVAATTANDDNYKAAWPNTHFYETASLESDVIAIIPQNAPVVKIDDAFLVDDDNWQKIEYNSQVGYVLASDIFCSKELKELTFNHARAKSTHLGDKINMYLSNSTDSEIVLTINDGEKMDILIEDVDYGEFYKVDYKGNKYFVDKDNVTTSLSSNQALALIIIGVTVLLSVIVAIAYFSLRKKKATK